MRSRLVDFLLWLNAFAQPCVLSCAPAACALCNLPFSRVANAAEANPELVKCISPPGFGSAVDVVVYNGNQPSSAWSVPYEPPVITSVGKGVCVSLCVWPDVVSWLLHCGAKSLRSLEATSDAHACVV